MPDERASALDILARMEKLERENDSLQKEVAELKSQLAPENWQELIIYRPKGVHNNKPLEISWTEIDDEEKRGWYRDGEPAERDVIGLVRRV